MCVYSLIPRSLPDYISQLYQHSCEIKLGSGPGMKLACVYVHAYICDGEHYFNMELVSTNSLIVFRLQAMVVYLSQPLPLHIDLAGSPLALIQPTD